VSYRVQEEKDVMAETATLDSLAVEDLEQRFETFVASHRQRAVRLAWRLLGGDDAAAQDVVQDAFVCAYRGLGRFRGEASLATWFYRILVHQAHNHRRWRAVRELWTSSHEDPPDPAAAPAGDPALRRRIAGALGALTHRQREAFVLVHMEGFTVREAAALMGSREGTVKSHLHRALQHLRRELADVERPGDEQ
jgi:RNA polymerase sigma-70 factor (ECF subfamily)